MTIVARILVATDFAGPFDVLVQRATEKTLREVRSSFLTFKAEDPMRLRLTTEMKGMETHLHRATELLHHGFPEDALMHVEVCLAGDAYAHHALGLKADVEERLGRHDESRATRAQAETLRRSLDPGSDIRSGCDVNTKREWGRSR